MNIQKLVFKMLVTLTYLVGVWALVLPISLAIIFMKEEGWRYGFTFIQSNFSWYRTNYSNAQCSRNPFFNVSMVFVKFLNLAIKFINPLEIDKEKNQALA